MKQSAIDAVKQYAKENKTNSAKLLAFVETLLTDNVPKVGRKASEHTQCLRQSVGQWLEQHKGQSITTNDITQAFQCNKAEANNVLKVFSSKLQSAGKAQSASRGRKATMWKIL